MKLVTFESCGESKVGVLEKNVVIDLNQANQLYLSGSRPENEKTHPVPSTMIGFLELGEAAKKRASEILKYLHIPQESDPRKDLQPNVMLDASDVHILPPIPVPPKIVCLGLNYRDHAEEAQVPAPESPIIFSKPSTAIIGPDDFVVYPKISSQVDYEVELAVVVGRRGKNISELDAFDYVGGYTVFNDISARDIQFADKQWFRGKSFDTFAPTGPCLVLKDQISDPHQLKMELRVNGEIRQSSTTANMIFKIPQLIAFISRVMTLQCGDIIATGTPAGVGFYAKPEKKLLKPGDLIQAEIEGIGVLTNRVVGTD